MIVRIHTRGTAAGFIRPATLAGIMLLTIFLSVALWSQEKDSVDRRDTVRIGGSSFLQPDIVFSRPVTLFARALQPDTPLEAYLYPGLYPGIPPPFSAGPFHPRISIIAPYLLQQERDREMRTFYSILGAITLGGAAYIGYRHIEKYGFLR